MREGGTKAWPIIKEPGASPPQCFGSTTKLSLEQKRPGCHSLFHINSLHNEACLPAAAPSSSQTPFICRRWNKGSESKTSLRNPVKEGKRHKLHCVGRRKRRRWWENLLLLQQNTCVTLEKDVQRSLGRNRKSNGSQTPAWLPSPAHS